MCVCVYVYVCVYLSLGAWKSSLQAKGCPSWNKNLYSLSFIQYFTQQPEILLLWIPSNHDVIQVHHYLSLPLGCLVGYSSWLSGSQKNAEWQPGIAKQSLVGVHNNKLIRLLCERQLLVGMAQVDLGKDFSIGQCSKQVICLTSNWVDLLK